MQNCAGEAGTRPGGVGTDRISHLFLLQSLGGKQKKRKEGRLVLQGLLPTQKETSFFSPRCFVPRSHRESVLLIGMDQGTYLHGSRQQQTSAATHEVHLDEAKAAYQQLRT